MLFYLILGLIVALLFYAADKTSAIHFLSRPLLFIAFLLTTVFEGCRNVNIGIDMFGYGILYFNEAARYSKFTSYIKNLDHEYGYFILNYLCSRFGSVHIFMFAVACIKSILVGLTAWHFRGRMNTFLFIFCYMMFFYWYDFSLMRQGIALCIDLYALRWFYDKKYVAFGICVASAYLFHASGIFILFLPIIEYVYKFKHATLLFCMGSAMVYLTATLLFKFAINSGVFLSGRYDHYEDSGVAAAKSNILILFVYLILTFFFQKNNKKLKHYIRSASFLGLVFLSLSSLFEIAFRISFYQMILLFIVVPMYIEKVNNLLKRRLLIICISLLYILHIYVDSQHGLAGTIPYKSILLGI